VRRSTPAPASAVRLPLCARAFVGALGLGSALAFLTAGSCGHHDTPDGGGGDGGKPDGADDADGMEASPPDVSQETGTLGLNFCDFPGSVVSNGSGSVTEKTGGPKLPNAPDLTWVRLPSGFCVHHFAHVAHGRQLRFAPGGDLFVASPSRFTAGSSAETGLGAVVVLHDDDGDGYADNETAKGAGGAVGTPPERFLDQLEAVQGLLFTDGKLYYQDDQHIRRVPFTPGQRQNTATPEDFANITIYYSATHWPKVLDIADDGTIYVTNGGDEGEACVTDDAGMHPFHGGVLKLDGPVGGTPVARGFRNAIALRCARGHNHCFAIELARDFSSAQGGREKIITVRDGDDWGFPCCATKDTPYTGVDPSCAQVQSETVSFLIDHSPFGLDFETGKWPQPWGGRMFVALHGIVGTWQGARLVAITMDPQTGLPLPASELDGGTPATFGEFAQGWDDGQLLHGRPADVAFAPDGRLFMVDDWLGEIVWIAPVDLKAPQNTTDAGTD
jgi:glucose/arabinose dehydrogenase